jgi:formylglycine-generating enzyme required for sulfatase activity
MAGLALVVVIAGFMAFQSSQKESPQTAEPVAEPAEVTRVESPPQAQPAKPIQGSPVAREESSEPPQVPEPKLIQIKGGCFQMGSPELEKGRGSDEQQHEVCVTDFAMGKYEVTVQEFGRFVTAANYQTEAERAGGCYGWYSKNKEWELNANGSWRNVGFTQEESHPVVCVSWNDAVAYVEWLSRQTGKRYRLPTEAEWEYAARAGTKTAYWWGDQFDESKVNGNMRRGKSTPVDDYPPNPWGLKDMLGNAWEWTCAGYEEKYNGAEKRCVAKDAVGLRVVRGGSWFNVPWHLRASYRHWDGPGTRFDTLGFRLAQDL